jgi:asparagine synthase (glutamine-hydrolysing)
MSAICGIFGSLARFAEAEIQRMLTAIQHRGPHGVAIHIDEQVSVALGVGYLRTAPSEPEPEVFANEDRSLLMVCDGQVFNREELAVWLCGRGHVLKSGHNAEILLHLFEEEGAAGWRRIDGQFALAIRDWCGHRVHLARDFLGVCPLFYWTCPDGVVFASEIKALLRHPRVPLAVDEVAISHYLTFLNVPGPRTLFAGIARVPASAVVTITTDGRVTTQKYWDLLDDPIPEVDDENFYIERVREIHARAVARRRPPGPVAALLSGGNDSSANAVYLARQAGEPLHTVTVGLAAVEGDSRYRDLEYARQVAGLVGSRHHELLLTTDEFLKSIPVIVGVLDDLVSEPSSIFLYHALRLAKEAGVATVITGEGNDELSCGHAEMIRIRDGYYRRWLPLQSQAAWVRRAAAVLLPLLSPARRDILHRAAAGEEYFWNFETAWMESEKSGILAPALWKRCRSHSPATVVSSHASRLRSSAHGSRDYLSYIIYVMMQDYYFGNLMLGKLNLLAGQVGVEPRCPYTAPDYAQFVFNIPARFKFEDGVPKSFFKKALAGVLPEKIIYRPKQGFRTPVVELFQGELGRWARPVLLDGGLTREGWLRRDQLDRLLGHHQKGGADHSNKLWTAIMLNLWYDRWIRSPNRGI